MSGNYVEFLGGQINDYQCSSKLFSKSTFGGWAAWSPKWPLGMFMQASKFHHQASKW